MKLSDNGLVLIKSFEKCRLQAYPDPGIGGEPFTIGWGSTGGVKAGDKITQAAADERLKNDIWTAEKAVSRLVNVALTQNQYDALVSLVFNIGAGALQTSTLLRKLNDGNYRAAGDQFGRWVFANNTLLKGLVRRRAAESTLFMTP